MKNIDEILQKCIQTNSKKTKEKLLDNYCDFCMKQISLEIDEMSLVDMYFENEISYKDCQSILNDIQNMKNRLFE